MTTRTATKKSEDKKPPKVYLNVIGSTRAVKAKIFGGRGTNGFPGNMIPTPMPKTVVTVVVSVGERKEIKKVDQPFFVIDPNMPPPLIYCNKCSRIMSLRTAHEFCYRGKCGRGKQEEENEIDPLESYRQATVRENLHVQEPLRNEDKPENEKTNKRKKKSVQNVGARNQKEKTTKKADDYVGSGQNEGGQEVDTGDSSEDAEVDTDQIQLWDQDSFDGTPVYAEYKNVLYPATIKKKRDKNGRKEFQIKYDNQKSLKWVLRELIHRRED